VRNKVRLIVATFSVVLLLMTSWVPALAATQGSCPANDTSKVRLWENSIGDTSDGDDNLWKCDSDADLGNDSHLPAGNCHSPFFGSATWSDCVSSYTLWTPTAVWMCFYRDANYVGIFDARQNSGAQAGTRFDLPVNDVLTSIKFGAVGQSNC
jgi:hypothetical protein